MHLSRNYLTSFNVMLCWFCRAIPAALRFWIPATIQFPPASGWLSAAILCRISCECENYLAQLTQFALHSQDTGSSNLIIPGHNCENFYEYTGCIYSSRNGYRSTTMLWNISGEENQSPAAIALHRPKKYAIMECAATDGCGTDTCRSVSTVGMLVKKLLTNLSTVCICASVKGACPTTRKTFRHTHKSLLSRRHSVVAHGRALGGKDEPVCSLDGENACCNPQNANHCG